MTLRGAKIHREAFYVYFVISTKKKKNAQTCKTGKCNIFKEAFWTLNFLHSIRLFKRVYIDITFITYAVTIWFSLNGHTGHQKLYDTYIKSQMGHIAHLNNKSHNSDQTRFMLSNTKYL